MLYQFKQALHIAGKDFPRGNHEVSEKQENHPHFLKYVGTGLITEAVKVPVVSTQTDKARNDKLLDRLVKQADARKAAEDEKEEQKGKPVETRKIATDAIVPDGEKIPPVVENPKTPVTEDESPKEDGVKPEPESESKEDAKTKGSGKTKQR